LGIFPKIPGPHFSKKTSDFAPPPGVVSNSHPPSRPTAPKHAFQKEGLHPPCSTAHGAARHGARHVCDTRDRAQRYCFTWHWPEHGYTKRGDKLSNHFKAGYRIGSPQERHLPLPNPVRIMRFSSSPEQGADTRDVDARGATALSERGEADQAVTQPGVVPCAISECYPCPLPFTVLISWKSTTRSSFSICSGVSFTWTIS
jgi:hypothetical protein